MWNQMINILENNLKYEILYFLKHNIKSVNLEKIQNELDLDNKNSKISSIFLLAK